MFRNYTLIALRNLLRQKGFSAINIIGLSAGMACSILILLWVRNEISYNRFNDKSDRLFRLVQTQYYVSGPLTTPCMPGPVARDLLKDIPGLNQERLGLRVLAHVYVQAGKSAEACGIVRMFLAEGPLVDIPSLNQERLGLRVLAHGQVQGG